MSKSIKFLLEVDSDVPETMGARSPLLMEAIARPRPKSTHSGRVQTKAQVFTASGAI